MFGDALVMGRDLVRRTFRLTMKTMVSIHVLYCRPELLHPFASAIDEPDLKVPEEMVRVKLESGTVCGLTRENGIHSNAVDGAHDGIGTGICAPA
jgi:hypothetical protein